MTLMGLLTSIFQAIAGVFGFAKQRSEVKNTPDQRANAEAAQIQADKEKARADIAAKDQSALNRDVAP